MAADFTIIQGTNQPPLVATLKDATNVPIDLTAAATVVLLLKNRTSNSIVPTVPVTIFPPATAGVVAYTWQASDTLVAGMYDARFLITWSDGTTQAVPSTEAPLAIEVVAQVAAGAPRLTLSPIKGYCTVDDVASFLGVPFSTFNAGQCAALLPRVERWIDEETNRSWSNGLVIGERFFSPFGLDPPSFYTSYVQGWVPLGSNIYCRKTPVQSIQSVTGRGWLDSGDILLVENLDWEIRDFETGLIRITVPSAYYRLVVNYTPINACPPDITQLAVMVTATWMIPNLNPDSWLVDSVQLPDLKVVYNKASNTVNVPPEADEIIERYRFRTVA